MVSNKSDMTHGFNIRHRQILLGGALLIAATALLTACASGTSTGDLQLVVADQTVENPIKDVIEVTINDDGPLYPDSAAGGSPSSAGSWTAGESLSLILWRNASEESEVSWPINVPAEFDSETLTIVVEIEDDQVALSSSALGIRETFDRTNPAEELRQQEAAAAEEAAEAADEVARVAEEETQAIVMTVRREAGRLSAEMTRMQEQHQEVLDEHATVYGDDDWATFKEIARKFKDYTTEALEELKSGLPNSAFKTDQVDSLNRDWQGWWRAYFSVKAREEVAARNNDSPSMDAVRSDEDELWDEWNLMFERIDELTVFSAEDL